MENITRCTRCKKTFIAEEMEAHKDCFVGVKQIPIVYYYTLTKEDKEIVMAKGKDGIMYRLVKFASDESIQGDKDDSNRRRVDKYLISNSYIFDSVGFFFK